MNKKNFLISTLIVLITFILALGIYANLNVIEVDPQSADGAEGGREFMRLQIEQEQKLREQQKQGANQ